MADYAGALGGSEYLGGCDCGGGGVSGGGDMFENGWSDLPVLKDLKLAGHAWNPLEGNNKVLAAQHVLVALMKVLVLVLIVLFFMDSENTNTDRVKAVAFSAFAVGCLYVLAEPFEKLMRPPPQLGVPMGFVMPQPGQPNY